MIKIKIDIVGGSLSGLSAAIFLKEHNKDISAVVHEKHKNIGYNHEGRRCGEAYTIEKAWNLWRPEEKSYFNKITKVETTIGEKKLIFNRLLDTSYILNRQEFICQLARKAENLGVEIHTNDKIESVNDLDGDYIVDASGCPSFIKRELGLKKGIIGIGYQQTLEDTNCFESDTIKIFFTGYAGYYWIFPRNPEKKEINLGVGTLGAFKYNLKKLLEDFKQQNNITGKINYVAGGLIPIGLQRPLKYKNILFVGDAGIGTYPLNGEGIYRAIISGRVAGRCLAQGYPEKYPLIITRMIIKYNLVEELVIRLNSIMQKIGPKAILTSLKFFTTIHPLFNYQQ